MLPWGYFFYIAAGFAAGSVLFSYWLPKLLCGVDVLVQSEDRNPGTANAMKLAGVPVGTLCLVCDIAKGFVPVFLASLRLNEWNPLFGVVMAAPVLGHAFSPMLRGKGGKAIAVSFGVLLGVARLRPDLLVCLAVLFVFFSVVLVLKPHSFRSIATYGLFAAYALAAVRPSSLVIGVVTMAAVVIIKHILHGERAPWRMRFLPWLTEPKPKENPPAPAPESHGK